MYLAIFVIFAVICWEAYDLILSYGWIILIILGIITTITPLVIPILRKKLNKTGKGLFVAIGMICAFCGGVGEAYIENQEEMKQEAIAQKQAEAAQQAAAEQAQEAAEQAKEAAEQKAEDEAAAAKMGVSYSEYEAASKASFDAHSACQLALINSSTWSGASANWIPDFSWVVSGSIITIYGDDVEMPNGFGAKEKVNYTCEYDMSSQTATIVNAG